MRYNTTVILAYALTLIAGLMGGALLGSSLTATAAPESPTVSAEDESMDESHDIAITLTGTDPADLYVDTITDNGVEVSGWYEGIADQIIADGFTREAVCADLDMNAGECADLWVGENMVILFDTENNPIPVVIENGMTAENVYWDTDRTIAE